jgi:hypothetical protein
MHDRGENLVVISLELNKPKRPLRESIEIQRVYTKSPDFGDVL